MKHPRTWGLVWAAGYAGDYFYGYPEAGRIWAVADLLGLVATVAVALRSSKRLADPLGPRIGALWLCLLVFGLLWIWVAAPAEGAELGFLAATIAMFGYVVMGLWLDLVFLAIGLAVTAIATAGYIWLRPFFDLWMAFLGGGTLFGSGLYIVRRWR